MPKLVPATSLLMSSQNGTSARIALLVDSAEQSIQRGAIDEATRTLQEATHLDADDTRVKSAWVKLQDASTVDDSVVLEKLRQCLRDGKKIDNAEVFWDDTLQKNVVSKESATIYLDLLLKSDREALSLSLLKGLLSSRLEASKALAIKLDESNSGILDKLLSNDDGLGALVLVLLNDAAWSSTTSQANCQKDAYTSSIVILANTKNLKDDMALALLVRLVTRPGKIEYARAQDIPIVLTYLDIQQPQKIRTQALLIVAKLLENTTESGEQAYIQFIVEKVASQTEENLIIALSAAAAVFPVVPASSAKLFLVEGFVPQLVKSLEQRKIVDADQKSDYVQDAALDLFSAASVDKSCREALTKYCKAWLDTISQQQNSTAAAKATLILAKLGTTSNLDLTTRLSQLAVVDTRDQALTVEGLAYTTLQPAAKEKVIKNENLLKIIIDGVKREKKLSSLTILSNLSAYRPPRSEEQKKMAQLKAYANATKAPADDPLDNDGMVTIRCKKLLDAGIVSSLTSSVKNTTSQTSLQMMATIFLSLSKEQKHRAKMAQEGVISALLLIYQRLVKQDKKSAADIASHALARILISTNPSHIFSSTVPVTSAVSAITPLLSPDPDQEERNLLPVFETLLALTNLASMEDNTARELIIRQSWETMENQLLLSGNTLVQRASVELVCNLMLSPTGVAKFADGGAKAKTRMHILLALADVEDIATRRAAGGALAMLTEWDTAVSAILSIERGIKILLGMCQDRVDDIRHRGVVCILNAISIAGEVGTQAKNKVKAEQGVEIIRTTIVTTKDANVLTIGAQVLQLLAP